MSDLVPSLDVLARRLDRERDQLQRHADALDTKAGLILGFSGLIAALGATGGVLVTAGRLVAVLAAGLCLLALQPRPFGAVEVLALRDQHLTDPAEVTALDLLDTDIEIQRRDQRLLARKSARLQLAMAATGLSGLLIAGGILVVQIGA